MAKLMHSIGGRIRAHRPDYQLVVYASILMLIGLIIIYAIGPQRALLLNSASGNETYADNYFALKQLVSISVAAVAMVTMMFVPFTVLKKYAGVILLSGIGLSVLLLIFVLLHASSLAPCSNGACRWLNLGPLGSFQPAELLKFGVLVFLARFMAQRVSEHRLNDWKESIVPILAVSSVVLFIVIVVQRDMGTGIALSSIIASMLFVAGVNRHVGLRLLIGALIVGAILVVTAPHRVERILTFLRGDQTSSQVALDEDYQITHAKIAIGSGGLMGVGIGNSVEATGYLPEALNDSLFAILGETFGFVGLTAIIVIFLLLLLRFLRIVDRSVDIWMKLVAAGAFGWLASHMVLNVASMIGIFPLTGITLPLLSFGGTSMLFIAMVVGMVFQISRYTRLGKVRVEEGADADISSGRRLRRTRYADRSGA